MRKRGWMEVGVRDGNRKTWVWEDGEKTTRIKGKTGFSGTS